MAGWHHWLDGPESEWTPGVGDWQGGLVCCNSWGRKESDTTERLIWSDNHFHIGKISINLYFINYWDFNILMCFTTGLLHLLIIIKYIYYMIKVIIMIIFMLLILWFYNAINFGTFIFLPLFSWIGSRCITLF